MTRNVRPHALNLQEVMLRKEIKLDVARVQSETPQRLFPHSTLSKNDLVADVWPVAALFSKSAEIELLSIGRCRQGSRRSQRPDYEAPRQFAIKIVCDKALVHPRFARS